MKTRRHARHGRLRNQTRRGGARLGEGAQGTVYDLNGADSFLSSLPAGRPTSVTLYTAADPPSVRLTPEEIDELFPVLRETRFAIAKVFKEKPDTRTIFLDEIASNRTILGVYGEAASRYLTIFPIDGLRDHRMVGAVFEYPGKGLRHVTFGRKCAAGTYPMDLPKLLTDILESLVILEARGYEHNDIKLDNIVRCGTDDSYTYKLIDWGEAAPLLSEADDLSTLRVGTPTTTSPIRWYCTGKNYKGKNVTSPNTMMGWRVSYKAMGFYWSAMFQEQYKRIRHEYASVLAVEKDKRTLYNEFRTTFGLFQLGMTALHAVYKYKLDYTGYKPIIEYLTSLVNAADEASLALTNVRSLLSRMRSV
jgi:hypothetical protein